jgi:hypothetical protein
VFNLVGLYTSKGSWGILSEQVIICFSRTLILKRLVSMDIVVEGNEVPIGTCSSSSSFSKKLVLVERLKGEGSEELDCVST